ncbi:MAG TPA: VanZ family protein [Patescibacteria group bacterium]|nr:VanZ family protein [Patescibacteria group bacterium]
MWLPVFLWAGVIFALSSIQQITVAEFFIWDFAAKKVAHLTEYAVLYALFLRATEKNWVLSFVMTMVYAASDEIHQSYVPGRTAAVYDLAFDFSGASISAYIIWKLKQIHPKKQKK